MTEAGNGFFVYFLRCADRTYCVGSTSDLPARVETHNSGRGPAFTACRRPVVLVYSESFATMDQARQREIQIKKSGYALDSTTPYPWGWMMDWYGCGSTWAACWTSR